MSIAATDITICSDALSLLGAEPIVSFDEDNDRARLSARHYPNSRDEMLERVPWKCARKRVALALSSQSVVFGLNSAMFALPGDCIFPWRTNLDIEEGGDGDIPWEVEGNFIVTSVSALNLHYIYRLLDTSQFDPLLAKAITYDLMEKFCYPITNSVTGQQSFAQMRDNVLKAAAAKNGQMGTKKRYVSTTLTRNVR